MGNYLVTGAAGFIGARTSQILIEQGHTVVGVDNLNDAYDVRIKEFRLKNLQTLTGFDFVRADISERSVLDLLAGRRFDAVINLAARAGVRYSVSDPWVFLNSNILGTLNMLELCRQTDCKKFLLFTASALKLPGQAGRARQLHAQNLGQGRSGAHLSADVVFGLRGRQDRELPQPLR